MEHPLPTPRQLLADLLRELSALPPPPPLPADGPLAAAPALRPLLATLHVLFPALVLPALDLLDRRRVVRWQRRGSGGRAATAAAGGGGQQGSLYQIRGDTPHVVYPRAWHCTCASFALRAGVGDNGDEEDVDIAEDDNNDDDDDDDNENEDDRFFSTPPCRHLLACLLADAWPAGLGACVVDGAAEADSAGAPIAAVLAGVVAGVQ